MKKRITLLGCTGAVWLLAMGPAAAKPTPQSHGKWLTYTDLGGFYKINFPSSWQVLNKGNAVVIASPGNPDERGVFGITPRPEGVTIEDSVLKEFSDPDRPTDLVRGPARIANLPATKVVGSKKGNPNLRVVEYYVQKGTQQYYILFQAPHATWSKYSPIFAAMITSMKFTK